MQVVFVQKTVLSSVRLKNAGKYFVKFSVSNCMKIHLSARDFYKRRQAGRQRSGINYFNRQSVRLQKGLNTHNSLKKKINQII